MKTMTLKQTILKIGDDDNWGVWATTPFTPDSEARIDPLAIEDGGLADDKAFFANGGACGKFVSDYLNGASIKKFGDEAARAMIAEYEPSFENIIEAAEGKLVNFYGISGNRFKLGRVVFMAQPRDGYHEHLNELLVCPNPEDRVFSKTPLARVYLKERPRDLFCGYVLVDENDRTVLKIGTDSVFVYTPSRYTSSIMAALFER